LSRRSGEKILSCPGTIEQKEEEERRPSMAARRLLTRGPNPLEPPEAQPQTVPVGKRTALKVQEKVAPRRAGIRATCRSGSAAARAKSEGGEPVRYYLGVDWADQTHAVWVVDERGTKLTARTVPHTAEGLSAWDRELDEWRAQDPDPGALGHPPATAAARAAPRGAGQGPVDADVGGRTRHDGGGRPRVPRGHRGLFSPACRRAQGVRTLPIGDHGITAPTLRARLGDAPERWESFRHLQAQAGAVPVTKRSGQQPVVHFR